MTTVQLIHNAFGWLECMGLKVGALWLHENEIAELSKEAKPGSFVRINEPTMAMTLTKQFGSPPVAFYAGAIVFTSGYLLPKHIIILPDGLHAQIIDGSAQIPLAAFAPRS